MTPNEIAGILRARSVLDEETGCWRWTGAHAPKGYGQMRAGGKVRAVHRLAHEVWIGPIPEGYEVDHVRAAGCEHRDCVNPAHLEAVTHAENVRRTLSDTCAHGHPLTGDNVRPYITERGHKARRCLTCRRAAQARARARKKERAA